VWSEQAFKQGKSEKARSLGIAALGASVVAIVITITIVVVIIFRMDLVSF
jgi:hypothetical protein